MAKQTFDGDGGRRRTCLSKVNTTDARAITSVMRDFARSVGSEALPAVVIRREPGCNAQARHRDGDRHGYALVLALQDGYNLTVCPRTHTSHTPHNGTMRRHCIPIELRVGQALLFDQLMLHGGGRNEGSVAQFGIHVYLQNIVEVDQEGLVGYVQRRSWSQLSGTAPC
eukprot:SAG11_NODE_336_length_10544_cov_9.794926_4_plen_169_part_00